MNNQSPKGHLNAQDRQLILTIVIHGLIGTLITLIAEVFLKFNYGVNTPLITTAFSLISLILTQLYNGPSASTVRIQYLEQLVASLQPIEKEPEVPQNASVDPNTPSA